MIPIGTDALRRLRTSSYTGRVIRVHRALRRLDFGPRNWLHPLLLPVFFTVVLASGADRITGLWGRVFELWIELLELDARVTWLERDLGAVVAYAIPGIELEAALPGPGLMLATVLVVGILMTGSYLVGRRRHLPTVYAVWALGAIQLSAVVMMSVFPEHFPHDIRGHVASGVEMSLVLIALVSWIMAAALYPLAFPLSHKILSTALVLGYLIVFTPVQYMLHAWLIHTGTLLFMPLLFVVFGFFIDIVAFIALYGWAVSWGQDGP